jgi:hypothetical protein
MTPDLVALSHAYLSLPGAFVHRVTDDGWRINRASFRRQDGTLWVFVDGAWTLDLTDAATGGVMLARLGDAVGIVEIGPDRIGLRYDSDCPTLGEGATLAEAVARAAVAVGRAG